MVNYCIVSLFHAVELGYETARPLANFFARPTVAIANSSEPRHIADYVVPSIKSDGTYYQSAEAIWATYSHNANGVAPTAMGANPTNGFAAAGTINTFSVTAEAYGSISAAAIAISNGASGAATAWQVVKPWHAGTTYYDHDPRWALIPRK